MGMLVPPAIFMIVIAQVTNTSAVALFLAGFVPAATIMVCLMVLVYVARPQIRLAGRSRKPSVAPVVATGQHAAVPLVIPSSSWAASSSASFTATEAGAGGGGLRLPRRASFYYRNVSRGARWRRLAYDSAILTAAVVFLLAGRLGVPVPDGRDRACRTLLGRRARAAQVGALAVPGRRRALITMMFGMVLEGLPAAVVLIPVVFPIAETDGHRPHPLQHRARPRRSASACSCRRWASGC